jgi:hypothetical protein
MGIDRPNRKVCCRKGGGRICAFPASGPNPIYSLWYGCNTHIIFKMKFDSTRTNWVWNGKTIVQTEGSTRSTKLKPHLCNKGWKFWTLNFCRFLDPSGPGAGDCSRSARTPFLHIKIPWSSSPLKRLTMLVFSSGVQPLVLNITSI